VSENPSSGVSRQTTIDKFQKAIRDIKKKSAKDFELSLQVNHNKEEPKDIVVEKVYVGPSREVVPKVKSYGIILKRP
jgi:hypothetical protein